MYLTMIERSTLLAALHVYQHSLWRDSIANEIAHGGALDIECEPLAAADIDRLYQKIQAGE